MTSPVDPTVLDLLRGSVLAPLIDRPVNDILRDMGLPPLPDPAAAPPLPELPPLPVIDIAALARPLTDMASSFGTGALDAAAGAGPNPAQMLSGIGTALQTAMTLGSTALQAAMAAWQGMGATAAAEKAGQAQQDGAELATQSTQEKAVLTGAATSVAVGAGLMSAVIAKYVASMVAAAPLLGSPGGQLFMVAATTEAIAEALAVIAKTRTELTAHSASMTQAGQKVPITSAPKGVDSMQQAMQMLQMLTPLMAMAGQSAQSLTQLAAANTALLAPKPAADPAAADAEQLDEAKALGGGAGGGAAGGGVGGGGGGFAPAATPLTPYTGTRAAGVSPGVPGTGAELGATGSTARPGGTVPAGSPGGMVPMGGAAAGAAGARGAGDSGEVPGFLVNAQHGDEVVGDIEGVALPVVGATEQMSAEAPPDKDLTL
ncbi:hypothetical protein [Nocardia farcinica]|uniref:hypothetical protein n=2 Tax=Nocardia farcinica TaxID=37329 RepID=UPI001894E9D3|nr:hypothetical protein [Nocardia farcinica]MBF6138589.1 hypothetical protein [Nocardia farcinica]MBF6373782.1 hypothetical protein [Nocardia farcinica]